MKSNLGRGWLLGCLVACLGVTTAGCGDDDGGAATPPVDLQRGTMAATREDACGEEPWGTLEVYESLGILLSNFPGGHKRGVDCILGAKSCKEVETCMALYLADDDKYDAELEQLPTCGSERTDHCEGNVAKYCVTDDKNTLREASYDCTLAGATCVEWQSESGDRWADCQAPKLECDDPKKRYCDGSRAVVCGETGDNLSAWVHDCADAWGSTCVYDAHGDATCEGPVVGEKDCDDGKDGDGDGKVDCDDDDCNCN